MLAYNEYIIEEPTCDCGCLRSRHQPSVGVGELFLGNTFCTGCFKCYSWRGPIWVSYDVLRAMQIVREAVQEARRCKDPT